MTIAIVGPTSYVAEHLKAALDEDGRGLRLISLRRKGEVAYDDDREIVFEDDLTIPVIKDMGISSVVLCASLDAKECELHPQKAQLVNTGKVVKLVDMLSRASVKRFMYLSTIKVYGEDLVGEVTEETLARPESTYAMTHYETELALRELASKRGFELIVVRLSNVFGAPLVFKEAAWALAANCFARQMASQGSIDVKSPEVVRNILPMGVLIDFITSWLEREIDTSAIQIVNVGSKTTLSMSRLARLIRGYYLGELKEDCVHLYHKYEENGFRYSIEKMTGLVNRIEEDDRLRVVLELRELCVKSREIFG